MSLFKLKNSYISKLSNHLPIITWQLFHYCFFLKPCLGLFVVSAVHFAPYYTGIGSVMLIWAAGARCKWWAHLHNKMLWAEAWTANFLVHWQALYHWATLPPTECLNAVTLPISKAIYCCGNKDLICPLDKRRST